MKTYYYLLALIVSLFFFNQSTAQSCPPTGFSDTISLFFFYDSGTSACVDRPATVTVDASAFTLVDCGDVFSVYDLTSGPPLANPNIFIADFGYGTCEYINGSLVNETLSIEQVEAIFKSIKVYPNPLTNGDIINIQFGYRMSATISLYSITGKLILSDTIDDLNTKPISLNNLQNGVYLLRIETDNISIARKVIVMR